MSQLIAVLTGDVIASRKIADPGSLSSVLDATLERLCERFDGEAERYRGDAFQLALPHAEHAMTAAVMLRADLIQHSEERQRWDARIAVAVGHDQWRPRQRIDAAGGAPFVRSGQALDGMDKTSDHLRLELLNDDDHACLALLTRFADNIIDGWSRYSAEAVGLQLEHGESQQALAKRLEISQPGVHKRLRTARWALIDDYLQHMHRHISGEVSRS
ncbi:MULTISPECIES: hypothetical protein [Halomonadaceae]|uniref:hypothetical protein n=1 Tax=Halomonadaceae TaxID=28256 RepID=UPI00159874E3|nr:MULTISPECIES: hypothetical protein [Halomonas]QJQ94686.1 hypothetical protein HIO72_04920 [Halomonas sp. PA5]